MKIIDIRNTQTGWVADVLLSPRSILPVSIPVMECTVDELLDFADSDHEHIAISDPRTAEEKAWDTFTLEWFETYQSLKG